MYIKKQQDAMNLYYIKCSKFSSNKVINIKHEIDGKINLDSYCINASFKMFETIDEISRIDLLKN